VLIEILEIATGEAEIVGWRDAAARTAIYVQGADELWVFLFIP
jgi:hypothetical protein